MASGHNLLASRRAMKLTSRESEKPLHDDPLAVLTPQERKFLTLIGEEDKPEPVPESFPVG